MTQTQLSFAGHTLVSRCPKTEFDTNERRLIKLAIFGAEHELATENGSYADPPCARAWNAVALAAEAIRENPRGAILHGLRGMRSTTDELVAKVERAELADLPIDLAAISTRAKQCRTHANLDLTDPAWNYGWLKRDHPAHYAAVVAMFPHALPANDVP